MTTILAVGISWNGTLTVIPMGFSVKIGVRVRIRVRARVLVSRVMIRDMLH